MYLKLPLHQNVKVYWRNTMSQGRNITVYVGRTVHGDLAQMLKQNFWQNSPEDFSGIESFDKQLWE